MGCGASSRMIRKGAVAPESLVEEPQRSERPPTPQREGSLEPPKPSENARVAIAVLAATPPVVEPPQPQPPPPPPKQETSQPQQQPPKEPSEATTAAETKPPPTTTPQQHHPQVPLVASAPSVRQRMRTASTPPMVLNPLRNPRPIGSHHATAPSDAAAATSSSRRGRRPSSATKLNRIGLAPILELGDADIDAKVAALFAEFSAPESPEFVAASDLPRLVARLDLKSTSTAEAQLVDRIRGSAMVKPDYIALPEFAPIARQALKAEQAVFRGFHRAAIDTSVMFVAYGIGQAKVEATVEAACTKMDMSSAGTLSTSEFRQALKSLDFGLNASEVAHLMRAVVPDEEGNVDYRQWIRCCFKQLAALLVYKTHHVLVREHEIGASLLRGVASSKDSCAMSVEAMKPLLCSDPFKLVPEEVSIIFDLYLNATKKPLTEPLDVGAFVPITARQLLLLVNADQSESQFAVYLNTHHRRAQPAAFERTRIITALESVFEAQDANKTGTVEVEKVPQLLEAAFAEEGPASNLHLGPSGIAMLGDLANRHKDVAEGSEQQQQQQQPQQLQWRAFCADSFSALLSEAQMLTGLQL